MKLVTAILGGTLVAVVVYLVGWFLARNVVDGHGAVIEVGGDLLVVLLALIAGASSFRASMAR